MNPERTPLQETLTGLSKAQLVVLHRIAKDPHKGLRPFFTNPHHMIALRRAMEDKHDGTAA